MCYCSLCDCVTDNMELHVKRFHSYPFQSPNPEPERTLKAMKELSVFEKRIWNEAIDAAVNKLTVVAGDKPADIIKELKR